MRETIEIGHKTYNLELDQEKFGYKDKTLHKVYKTTESVMAMGCIGAMRFVFDENGDILSQSYPMMDLNKDFTFVSLSEIGRSADIIAAYEKIQKKKIMEKESLTGEPVIFFKEKNWTIREILEILTDEEIDNGKTCDQTIIDLRNALNYYFNKFQSL